MRCGLLPAYFALIAGGCSTPSMCDLTATPSLNGLRTLTCSATLNTHGLRMKIPASASDEAFLVSGLGTERIAVSLVTAPDGELLVDASDWYTSEYRYSNGILPYETDTAFNYPVQDIDSALIDGEYVVELIAIDDEGYTLEDVPVEITVHINETVDVQQGNLQLHVLYTQQSALDPAIQSAVLNAMEKSKTLLATFGLNVEVTDALSTELDAVGPLPNPLDDPEQTYIGLHDTVDPNELLIVVGDEIQAPIENALVHGIAGGIPGTLTQTNRAVILLSWLTHAGQNGTFNESEIDLMAETIAHELLHYTGLFHPIDDSEGTLQTFDLFDNFDDTEDCTTAATCETVLGSNLMFPYTICDGNTCQAQNELTSEQRGVLHRYTGVR